VHRLEREAHELLARHSTAQQPPDKCGPARVGSRTIDGHCILSGPEGFSSPAAASTWRDHELRQVQPVANAGFALDQEVCQLRPRPSCASRWAAFVAAPPGSIAYGDVPWPPDATADLLRSITAHSTDVQHGDEAEAGAGLAACPASCAGQLAGARAADTVHRRAHRLATLRWHPDKFEQRFGSAIAAADRVRILQRTQEICQGLNDMRSELGL